MFHPIQSFMPPRTPAPRSQVGLGAGVAVEASGWIPILFVVAVLGLAIYGAAKAAPKAKRSLREHTPHEKAELNKEWERLFGTYTSERIR
jgi:hypothetical protein